MNETCIICGRVFFGDIVRLAGGAWRHDECAIGSEAWALYFQTLPAVDKAKLAELYRCFIGVSQHYTQGGLDHVDSTAKC
jgi:hypothetical protein